jgi:sec-independent protein translocase protein TatA
LGPPGEYEMGGIGIWQIVLILAIVLILFGAGKLPRVMGDVAKGVKSFKAGLKEDPEEEGVKEVQQSAEADITPEPVQATAEPAPVTNENNETSKG